MSYEVAGAAAWAVEWLARAGYRPCNVMDEKISEWWGWYRCRNDWYDPPGCDPDTEEHMTLHPARTVCDEWASLLMNDGTTIGSPDPSMSAWIDDRLGGFVEGSADFVSMAFGLGTGAWVVDLAGAFEGDASPSAEARVRQLDAGCVIPLAGDESCAFASRVAFGGREWDQVQVHEPIDGQYVITTWLFDPDRHGSPVAVEGVSDVYLTGSELPTYALVRPAIANTHEEHTPMGVSVFDCGVDAVKGVDEAYDLLYWSMRMGKTRLLVDERAIVYDSKSGRVKGLDTVDKRLYRAVGHAAGDEMPVTVFNPDLRAEQIRTDLDLALSLLSFKCGFGQAYFSFDGHQGVRTATEVSADNSQLFRNVRRHERSLGASIRRLARGAYAAELAARTGARVADADVPDVEVRWDDSIVTDTAAERDLMKDDIARGLCPAYLYPMRYYGMDEAEARALTGEAGAAEIPEEA